MLSFILIPWIITGIKKIHVDVKIDNTVHEINKNIFLRSQEVKLV